MFSALFGWALYFAPTLVAWYRSRNGLPIVLPLKNMAIFNLLIAWTGVGWLLLLANALGYNPVATLAPKLAKFLQESGLGGPMPPPQQGGAGPGTPGQPACGNCGGTGSARCSHCQGRGSWYEPPTTASGSAELKQCSYCMSSGHIRCPNCNGTGRLAV